jgi:hypothetical protein
LPIKTQFSYHSRNSENPRYPPALLLLNYGKPYPEYFRLFPYFCPLAFPMTNQSPHHLLPLYLVLLFVFILAFPALAQQTINENGESEEENAKKDQHSPDSVYVAYFSLNEQAAYTRHAVSKPLNQFQEFDPAKQYNRFYANLGNIGSASVPLQFNLSTGHDFRFRYNVFSPYKLYDDSIRFYISESPFTHLRYHMGPAKEQKFDLSFAQRIGNGIYLGLDARFTNAPGIYLRQRAFNAGATFYAAFLYPTQRYGAMVTYRFDRLANYENGGLDNIQVFTQNMESNRKVIGVNLSEAINRSKANGIVFQQYFNILKPTIIHKTDSTFTETRRKFDAGRLIHTFRYNRTGTAYEDKAPTAGFYPNSYTNEDAIFDSVQIHHLENCFVYSNEVPDTLGKSFPLQYSFGIRLQTDRLFQDSIETTFNQTIPFGMLKGIIMQKTFFKASADLVLGGYNSGDHTLSGSFYQFFGNANYKAYLNASKGKTHPDYFLNHYYSDNFRWDNSFGQQDFVKADFGVILRGFDLNASYTRLTNYAFLNAAMEPEVASGAMTVLSGYVSKEFRLKHWLTSAYVSSQLVTPDTLIQLPAIIAKLTVCYDNWLFKKALHAQIGISATYHSEWYADAYMPALRAFYRQNSFIAGNYPYLDAFINLNIKRARLFVKYEHFNAGLMSYSYIMVPGYPQADAAFKFGISWLFFD